MEIKQVIEPKYVMKITDEERKWLKGYLQNPQCHPDDEESVDRRMREAFFMALTTA